MAGQTYLLVCDIGRKIKTGPLRDPASSDIMRLLDGDNVGGLESFGTLFDRELHFLIFLKAFVTFHLEGGEVHEYIFTVLTSNEAETFGCIEPFDSTDMTFF
jgi:hypothetical protein